MRTFVMLAALSCASLAVAQELPEAPPRFPPSSDDEADSESSDNDSSENDSSSATTTISTTSTIEVDSTTSEPASLSARLSTAYQPGYTLEPETTSVTEDDFVTIRTSAATPDDPMQSGTETGSADPPIVTGAATVVSPHLAAWAGITIILAKAVF